VSNWTVDRWLAQNLSLTIGRDTVRKGEDLFESSFFFPTTGATKPLQHMSNGSHDVVQNESADSEASNNIANPDNAEIDHSQRLSRPGPARIVFYTTWGFSIFWTIGFLRTRRMVAHQFLAENSHRLPTSEAGWYLYHRAKNYHVAWKGFKGGWKLAFVGGACTYLYAYVEEMWDKHARLGNPDASSSLVAGTVTGGVYALVKRMPRRQVWRCMRAGMLLGLVSGVTQDLARWGRGYPPWYLQLGRRQQMLDDLMNVETRQVEVHQTTNSNVH